LNFLPFPSHQAQGRPGSSGSAKGGYLKRGGCLQAGGLTAHGTRVSRGISDGPQPVVTSSCQLWIRQLPRGTNRPGCSAGVCREAGCTGTMTGVTSPGQVPGFPGPQGSFPSSALGTAGGSAVGDGVSWARSSMADITGGISVPAAGVSPWHGGLSVGTLGRRMSPWALATHGGLSLGHMGGTWPIRATLIGGTVPEAGRWGATFRPAPPITQPVHSPHQPGQSPDSGDPGSPCGVTPTPERGTRGSSPSGGRKQCLLLGLRSGGVLPLQNPPVPP